MPRASRAISVGYPHHITQRGNYRQTVFSDVDDYARYLKVLARYAEKYGLEIWAYCLMPNHVHLVGVPSTRDSMALTFRTLHRAAIPAGRWISYGEWRRFSDADSFPVQPGGRAGQNRGSVPPIAK